jgi:hypothetical protein
MCSVLNRGTAERYHMTKGAVATRDSNQLAPQSNDQLFGLAGYGMENVKPEDVSIPRFKILQDLSPEVNKRKAQYIEGAEPGLILNTATKEITKSIDLIPCIYRRHHIEWLPNREGFVADHGEDDTLTRQARQDEKRNLVLSNGNLIVPTGTWYVLALPLGLQAIIPMSRTQLTPSRDWMTQATTEKLDRPKEQGPGKYTPPLFYRGYTLTTVIRDKGENSWFVWAIKKGPTIFELAEQYSQPDLMQQALAFAQLVRSGEVKVGADAFSDDDNQRQQENEEDPM